MFLPPSRSIAIAGIHTGIGKTVVSAVVAEALGADYWKPVQAGIEERDMLTVQALLSNGAARVHAEAVLLKHPMSPHAAAAIEGVAIDYTQFVWPQTNNGLIIETAGGLLSPISAKHTMADFLVHFRLPTLLVTQNYLGSINHTLLTIEIMKSRKIPICGLIISGEHNIYTESFVSEYASIPILAHIPQLSITHQAIAQAAQAVKTALNETTSQYL